MAPAPKFERFSGNCGGVYGRGPPARSVETHRGLAGRREAFGRSEQLPPASALAGAAGAGAAGDGVAPFAAPLVSRLRATPLLPAFVGEFAPAGLSAARATAELAAGRTPAVGPDGRFGGEPGGDCLRLSACAPLSAKPRAAACAAADRRFAAERDVGALTTGLIYGSPGGGTITRCRFDSALRCARSRLTSATYSDGALTLLEAQRHVMPVLDFSADDKACAWPATLLAVPAEPSVERVLAGDFLRLPGFAFEPRTIGTAS